MSDYSILGLSPGATAEEVKKAHRKLVKEHHPDRAGDGATETLAKVNAAYDRIKAGKPDLGKNQGPATSPFTYEDFTKAAEAAQAKAAREAQARADQRARQQAQADAAARRQQRQGSQGRANPHARDFSQDASRHSRPGATHRYSRFERDAENATMGRGSAGGDTRQSDLRAAAQRRAEREARAQGRQAGGRTADTIQEMPVSAGQRGAMQEAIDRRKKQEAYKRVTELRGGIYQDPRKHINTDRGDLPGFHAADQVTFKGRTMQIHLGSEAKHGRNIIAMPDIDVLGGAAVASRQGAVLFEVSSGQGSGTMRVEAKDNPLKDRAGRDIEVVFGSERVRKRDENKRFSQR